MSEIEIIEKEILKVNKKYLDNVIEIISDYNNENKTKDDYKGRQIYELLQNADDCYTSDTNDISVKFELRGNKLIIQNTGRPFTARGITSLMHPDASSKYKDTIGCKGLGFRSVLNWSYDITICTSEFCVNFSEDKAIEKINYYKNNSDKTNIEELNQIGRIAILSSATIIDKKIASEYLDENYSTAIVLCCDEKYIETIQNQLVELQFEELLFLKHIRNITIKSPKSNRNIEAIDEGESFLIQDNDKITSWKVWGRRGEINQANGKPKKYELMIAYNTEESVREIIRKQGVLYSFFKTEIPMPFPFLIHGTFDLTSERNSLIKDNENNRILINYLIDFILEKGTSLADEYECTYDALKFLIPASELYFLDKEYDFTEKLKNKVKEFNVFPSINGKYISINDNPKYSEKNFCNVLNKNTFKNLLKHCDDEKIKRFMMYDCNIRFFDIAEIVPLINIDADEYVNSGLNIQLIELFCDYYNNPNIAPQILQDSEGLRITDNDITVFNNPENAFALPDWSKLRFINKNLENKLRNYYNCTIRRLIEKLEKFGCDEYSFDKVLRELNNQCKDDLFKIKSLLKWLFETWKNNEQKFVSSLTNIDVKIITRDNNISGCSKCYFGKEYNNEIGERIVGFTNNPVFIADIDSLGFKDEPIELVKIFFKQLGVKEYPIIESTDLNKEQTEEYIKYNSKYITTLYTDRNESYSHSAFFSQYGNGVRVDSIKDIEEILSNASFNDILYWILNDNDLYSHLVNDKEVNPDSYMKGFPPKKIEARYVRKDQMKSWLHKIFTSCAWLPTMSGKKVNAYNLTVANHKLSPIVEVLSIDYDVLNSMFSRNCKKDIEALFEKLEIAEDIVNLSKEKIYDILLNLSELDVDYSMGKKIYTQLNLFYKDDRLNKLVTDNLSYEKFKKEGKVLSEKNSKYEYLPVSDVFYVGKKVYSDDILDDFPKLALNRRVGDSKVEKMFCVQPISKIGNVEVDDIVLHPLNDLYQKEYQKVLPYIYAKRIDYDNKNRELNILKKSKICLVLNAKTLYRVGKEEKHGKLKNFEVIYSNNDKVAYIRIPEYIQSIEQLKREMAFISSISEVITTMIDVDGDKDAFTIILRCQNTKEIEDYFKGNGDDTLNIVNLSKEKFNTAIDPKEEFWDALSQATNIEEEKIISDLEIDYTCLNSNANVPLVTKLFSDLNIDIVDYNKYAYEPIDFTALFQDEFKNIMNKYRSKYLLYVIKKLIESGGKYSDFEKKKQDYDFMEIQFFNSIKTNVKELFIEKINVSLELLDGLDGNYEDYISQIKVDEEVDLVKNDGSTNENTSDNNQIDYRELNNLIADSTCDKSIKPDIEANPVQRKGPSGAKNPPKTHNEGTQLAKDYDGFVAESKVYNVLMDRIKEKGSVEWISGNAEKAGVIEKGNDTLGYDLRYSDSNGIHYVEVKGTQSNIIEFNLTKNEYEFADKNKDKYEVWFVFVDESKMPKDPIELGNIMLFDNGESFFNNSRFSVEQSEFKIRAKIKEGK